MAEPSENCSVNRDYSPLARIIHEQGGSPVILSAAKNLACFANATQILRCAQDDRMNNPGQPTTQHYADTILVGVRESPGLGLS